MLLLFTVWLFSVSFLELQVCECMYTTVILLPFQIVTSYIADGAIPNDIQRIFKLLHNKKHCISTTTVLFAWPYYALVIRRRVSYSTINHSWFDLNSHVYMVFLYYSRAVRSRGDNILSQLQDVEIDEKYLREAESSLAPDDGKHLGSKSSALNLC